MYGARWHGAGDVRVEEIDRPTTLPGQVLVEVERCGICGIDLLEFLAGPVNISSHKVPVVLGHEVVGTVAECPDETVALGTRVIPDITVGCGTCWACVRHEDMSCQNLAWRGVQLDGGFAHFMVADAATLVPVPDGLDVDRAVFAEPLAVAIRSLRKAGDVVGAVVCVMGAGVFGGLSCQVAANFGAASVIAVDRSAAHLRAARQLGATEAVRPELAARAVLAASGGRGADIVVETTGGPKRVGEAVRLSRRGGTVALLGLRDADAPLPLVDVVVGERRLIGIAGHIWDHEVTAAVRMLAEGHVDPRPLISTIAPLDRIVEDGFARLATDRDTLEVLIDPTKSPG